MKTKYKPIAMRCTKEQFEGIKDRINLPIVSLDSFKYFPYLTNNLNYENVVSNIIYANINTKREIIKNFDAEYFLDCCGREKPDEEVVFKGSELQYRHSNTIGVSSWINCSQDIEYRLKPKPNLDADIAALQQKAKELGIKITITFE